MTQGDEDDLERGGDDLLAAEYVLGVLSAEQRRAAALRIDAEPAFARLVEAWTARLSPLDEAYAEAAPPDHLRERIEARLFGVPETPGRPGLLQSLAFWRWLAVGAVAALLALALWTAAPFLQPSSVAPAERLVASLASDETDVRYLVVYDGTAGRIGLSHVTGDRAAGRDFELWVIGGGEVLSLGIVPVGATVEMPVADPLRSRIASGAQFAITLEPPGGAPGGVATGPIVAAGELRSI